MALWERALIAWLHGVYVALSRPNGTQVIAPSAIRSLQRVSVIIVVPKRPPIACDILVVINSVKRRCTFARRVGRWNSQGPNYSVRAVGMRGA